MSGISDFGGISGQGHSFGGGPSETGDISSSFGNIVSGGGFDVFGTDKPFYKNPALWVSVLALGGVAFIIKTRG